MKSILFAILFFITSDVFMQEKFIKIVDAKKNEPMLVGEISRVNFNDSTFSIWFDEEYEYYAIDTIVLETIKNKIDNLNIEIIMGTWCSDSRREIPHFYKILEYLNFPNSKVRVTAVDRKRKSLDDRIDSFQIELIPTIIFFIGNKEAGRIVESPINTLEDDIKNIIVQ